MANSGGTSLMFAAGAGHTEAAKVLLDAGADVNAKLQATPEFLEQVRKALFFLLQFMVILLPSMTVVCGGNDYVRFSVTWYVFPELVILYNMSGFCFVNVFFFSCCLCLPCVFTYQVLHYLLLFLSCFFFFSLLSFSLKCLCCKIICRLVVDFL